MDGMAKISQPGELLRAELAKLLYVEEELVNSVLPELKDSIENGDLKGGVTLHATQTHDHVVNLHRAFELLGDDAEPEKDPSLDGLRKSHHATLRKLEGTKLQDFAHATAVVRTEHLEIAAYGDVLALVRAMHGPHELVELLEQNLADEHAALERAKTALEQLSAEAAAVAATPG
jgi:ferritin-like metal-binding protein YciE